MILLFLTYVNLQDRNENDSYANPEPVAGLYLHSKNEPAPCGIRVDKINYTVGGKGINVARMLKTLGRPALALSFAGGPNGEKIKHILKQQGIFARFIETYSETRVGINQVVEEPQKHTWWIENGEELREAEIVQMEEHLASQLKDLTFLGMSGTIPGKLNKNLYLRMLHVARSSKAEIYLDARGESLKLACEAGGFFLKHNRDEVIQTFEIDPFHKNGRRDLIKILSEKKIWGCLITDGEGPVLFWDGFDTKIITPPPARIISAVGCGDATLAGIIYGRANGMEIGQAIKWGLACGVADVSCPGPCEAEFNQVKTILNYF